MGFPGGSFGKESACNAGDTGSTPGSGRSAGEGIDYSLQYSWASLAAQLVKIHLQCRTLQFDPWVGKIPWGRERPLQYSGLESAVDCIVHGVTESDTTERLSPSLFHFSADVTTPRGLCNRSGPCGAGPGVDMDRETGEPGGKFIYDRGGSQVTGKHRPFSDGVGRTRQPFRKETHGRQVVSGPWSASALH